MAVEESEYAPGWKPENEGDSVEGKVLRIDVRDDSEGRPYPILTLEDEGGTQVAVHAFHTVLKRELADRLNGLPVSEQVGTYFHITYLGRKQGGISGRGYAAYRVRSNRDGTKSFDWGSVLDNGGDSVPIAPAPVPAEPVAAPAGAQFGDVPF